MTSKPKPNQNVRLATVGQLTEIWKIVLQAVPKRLAWEEAKYWMEHPLELAAKIRAIFKTAADPYADLIAQWEEFYRTLAIPGLKVDLSSLRIGAPKEGFTRLIVVLPGLKIEEVLAQCKKRFSVWRWTEKDLDAITKSTRNATTEPYAIWVRDTQEADPVHANKSYNALAQEGVVGITLLERLLYDLKYFMETGKHLDLQNVTLCTGSLCSGGDVASVGWCDGELCVNWYDRGSAYPLLRVREAGVS